MPIVNATYYCKNYSPPRPYTVKAAYENKVILRYDNDPTFQDIIMNLDTFNANFSISKEQIEIESLKYKIKSTKDFIKEQEKKLSELESQLFAITGESK